MISFEVIEFFVETLVAWMLVIASTTIVLLRRERFVGKGGNIVLVGAWLVCIGTFIGWLDEFLELSELMGLGEGVGYLLVEDIVAHGLGFTLLYVGLAVYIARSEKADRRVEEALAEAEAANLAKSNFVASMSHELRTPLNSVLGYSEMIRDEVLGTLNVPKYREYAGDIHHSGQHLLKLIDQLLDISKIESGKLAISPILLNVADELSESIRSIRHQANQKFLRVELVAADRDLTVFADRYALRQMISNLLSNAVKFTPHGGRITVKADHEADGGALIVVTDSGRGMPPDQIARLTQPFEQLDNHFGHANEGTGLGLAIVQSLIELHGGRLTIDSEVGRGATVAIAFPAPPKTLAAA